MGHIIKDTFGKEATLIFEGVIPDNLRFLSNGWWLKKAETVKDTIFDLVISLDTADQSLLMDEEARQILANAKQRIKIDHHLNSHAVDGLDIIRHVSSVAEIIENLAAEHNWTISKKAASFLFVGIYTDTAGFMHDYTTPETLRAAARLMEHGFNHTWLIRKTGEKKQETFLNNVETLSRVLFSDDGKIGYTTFSLKKTAEGTRPHRETYWLHEQIMTIETLTASVVFKELDAGDTSKIQVSVRSKYIPINKFAEDFGGGGHALAAGFTLNDMTMVTAVTKVIPKLNAYLNEIKNEPK
jgi:phosphoesterase RecJ-like protein